MHSTSIRANGNTIIPTDWRIAALRSVRDRLQSLAPDALLDARDDLAVKLSEAIGGLCVKTTTRAPEPARNFLDDGPDFELTADDLDPAEWPCYVEPTPLDVLAADFALPALSGGSPDAEPFTPTDSDWSDYAAYCELQDSLDMQEDARRCGMAV